MKRKDVLRLNTVVRWAVACVGMALCSSPVLAAVADGSFEFAHKPALDGAGYLIQPTNNVRASGNMAIEDTDTLSLPGFADVFGRGTNNNDGTFSYDGPSELQMAYIQAAGAGGAGPAIPSPFNNTRTFTVEARFRVSGDRSALPNHDLFCFEHNPSGGSNFNSCYGRQGSDGTGTLTLSPTGGGGTFTTSGTTIPLNYGDWATMRLTSTDSGGGVATYATFIKFDNDAQGWYTGPTGSHTPDPNRNRGALVRSLTASTGVSDTKLDIDYIRWKLNVALPTTEALTVTVACGGDVSGSTAGVPDGTTDGADLAYLYNNWGSVPVGTLGDIAGTTGPDGIVDGADVGKIYNCWAQADGAPASVPEPASVGVFGLGLASLLAARRRA